MYQGGISQGAKDAFHAVFNRQNETGGQLTQPAAGIHQGRGVGQKFEIGHDLVKDLFDFLDSFFVAAVVCFSFGNVAGHPAEHFFRRFDNFAVAVLFKVSSAQNPSGIIGKIYPIFNEY